MDERADSDTVREAVGVFQDAESFEGAIEELCSNGFDRSELSLLATESAVEDKLGHRYSRVEETEDDPDVPRMAYVSTEAIGNVEGGVISALVYVGAVAAAGAMVASGGTLAATIAAAGVAGGAGGLIGSALARLVGHRYGQMLQEQLSRGGLVLWANCHDREHEDRAVRIMRDLGGEDVHVHTIGPGR